MHNHGLLVGERGAFSNNAESSSELPLLCDSKGEVRQNSPMLNLHKTWRGRCVWQDAPNIPTHAELSSENQYLRLELESLRAQNGQLSRNKSSVKERSPRSLSTWSNRKHRPDHDEEGLEDRLWDSLSAASIGSGSTVTSWADIVLPDRNCSKQLIAYDKKWNSWVHYAVEYPRFENECDSFIFAIEAGSTIETQNASWMAVYFSVLSAALLMMGDDEGEGQVLPRGTQNRRSTSRMWYDAAIFALWRADFMRAPSIHTVQAIAVLGMCFNTWGDIELGQHMWTSAIRVAGRIGLNTPYSRAAGSCLSEEAQHRLWWTLVICEWLNLPYRPPVIDEIDFDVPLPRVMSHKDDGNSAHDQVDYHIFMARSAIVVYRFRATIRSGLKSLDELTKAVRSADEELAQIIDTLPPHLQPDIDTANEEIRQIEFDQPWIKWQRYDLTLVLLHLRLRLHRNLQAQWLSDPDEYSWAKAVSVSSAMSVIWINRNWDQPSSLRKQWALSHHIFVSAILLVRQCETGGEGEVETYTEAIRAAIDLLESVKEWNMLAHHAATILRDCMGRQFIN
ncbi:hypothetical protein BJX68DRAFT_268323 [Aspergillus pseudodeflectus]|uniref:Xylanolytic transcriptional activator regulatory domain-containing protein n=1 Tax=Aspergillus pseudodeflectus TaxID=176178 RepID=A0ABR4K4R9_9EURO